MLYFWIFLVRGGQELCLWCHLGWCCRVKRDNSCQHNPCSPL